MKDFEYKAHSDDPDFQDKVKELLLYRKVVKVEQIANRVGLLTLDNGVQLQVEGNEGCGGCSNGWFYLNVLNTCDNATPMWSVLLMVTKVTRFITSTSTPKTRKSTWWSTKAGTTGGMAPAMTCVSSCLLGAPSARKRRSKNGKNR